MFDVKNKCVATHFLLGNIYFSITIISVLAIKVYFPHDQSGHDFKNLWEWQLGTFLRHAIFGSRSSVTLSQILPWKQPSGPWANFAGHSFGFPLTAGHALATDMFHLPNIDILYIRTYSSEHLSSPFCLGPIHKLDFACNFEWFPISPDSLLP